MPSHPERVRRNYPEGVPQFGRAFALNDAASQLAIWARDRKEQYLARGLCCFCASLVTTTDVKCHYCGEQLR